MFNKNAWGWLNKNLRLKVFVELIYFIRKSWYIMYCIIDTVSSLIEKFLINGKFDVIEF